jgi:hypothetical protein
MKKILLFMGFCCTVSLVNNAQAQEATRGFQDSHHNSLGTIRNGSIYDKDNNLKGQFLNEDHAFTIKNGQQQTIGYIVRGQEFQDANHKAIGYAKVNGTDYIVTIENAAHTTIGYIKPGGIVENSSHNVIGYDVQTEPLWGAAYFLLLKF